MQLSFFTLEKGGALFCKNEIIYKKMWCRHNFGHDGPEKFTGLGINAKMSELQAAMGLSILPYIEYIIEKRKAICEFYDQNLSIVESFKLREEVKWNYAYYPIVLESETRLVQVMKLLNEHEVYPRRYFYPSLNSLDYISKKGNTPVCEKISKRILCLPLYVGLSKSKLIEIVKLINKYDK